MARFDKDPFPGTDYSQFASWEKVITPDGGTYYVVPNFPQYVYDPVASNATGRKVFRSNPKGNIEKQKEEEAALEKARKQQEFNQSIQGQAIPVVLGTGGLVAASQLMKPGAQAVQITKDGSVLMSDGTILGQGATAAAPAATQTLGNAAASGVSTAAPTTVAAGAAVPEGYVAVGTAADGGTMIAPATEAQTALGYAPYLGLAGAALGGYGVYDAIQNDSVGQGALSGAGMGLGIGAAAPLLGLSAGPLGWGALAAYAAGGALLGGGLTSIFGHESTRDVAKKHTGQLLDQGTDDTNWQNYVSGMREQYNSAPPDPSRPYHGGQYASWDEYKKAGLDAKDLTGVYGNLKTYGPAWANLTQAQREAVTQANIESGLYNSHKGEVEITDSAKAKENFDNVMKGFQVGAQHTNAQVAAQAAKPAPVVATPAPAQPAPVLEVSGPRPKVDDAMKPFLKFTGSGVRKVA